MAAVLLGFIALGCDEYWAKDKIAGPDDGGTGGNGGTGATVSYAREIQPIFDGKCVICHGSLGGLALTSHEALAVGGNSGPSAVPGDAAGSLLVRRIDGTIAPQMPMGAPLSEQEVGLIRTWIDEGALNN